MWHGPHPGRQTRRGIAPLKAGIAFWEASGGNVRRPNMKAFLAEAMALTGDLDDALHLIDEQIEQIERPGWEERLSYAEIFRLKGWMLSLKGDLKGAEQTFRLTRLGAPPAGENVGAAHLHQPRPPLADPRQTPGRIGSACPGLRLVHRRLRHQGSAGREVAARRTGVVRRAVPHHHDFSARSVGVFLNAWASMRVSSRSSSSIPAPMDGPLFSMTHSARPAIAASVISPRD